MRRLMRSRAQTLSARNFDPKNVTPFESSRVSTLDRFADEPEPHEDEMIVTHYLKHHPQYEFRNFEEHHVDAYRHWLHSRGDYYNTETYPAKVSPWEQGSKVGHLFFLLFPFFSLFWIGNQYKAHLKQKNVKMNIVGVFSQNSC
jgi:hypothetical protein